MPEGWGAPGGHNDGPPNWGLYGGSDSHPQSWFDPITNQGGNFNWGMLNPEMKNLLVSMYGGDWKDQFNQGGFKRVPGGVQWTGGADDTYWDDLHAIFKDSGRGGGGRGGGGGGGRNAHAMGRYDPNFSYGGKDRGGGNKWGNMFGGLPSGFNEENRFGHGAPGFYYNGPEGNNSYGPHWQGDSIFNANNLGNAPNAVAPRQFAPGQVGSSSVPAPGGWGGNFGGGSSGNLGSFGDKIANASFKHTLFNMDNGRANAYSYMKYMSNNGFGSSAPWAKNMPTWKEYNQQWDQTLRDYRAGKLNFRGPTRQQRRDAKGGPGPYGPNSRMMQGT
jgi:hypothetical protein